MKCEDLNDYFKKRKVSKTELMDLLSWFDICPSSQDKLNLVDFAAREISEVGMYQRIARHLNPSSK